MKNKITAYLRPEGEVGIRNHILVMASVVCANKAVSMIGKNENNVVSITHPHGCDQAGEDRERTLRTLAGVASNPNVAGVIIVGLGCETISAEMIAEKISATEKPVYALEIQNNGGVSSTVEEGKRILKGLKDKASKVKRGKVGIDQLVVGLECGGSDAFSGITANPAVGVASDLIVENQGSVILSETPEFIGAEHLLIERCSDSKVKEKLAFIVQRFEQKAKDTGLDIRGANPTPGNMAGGITTLEEKSLGCIYKGGTSEVKEVIEYAEKPNKKGLIIMDTPGNDVESMTGMAAGGAQIMIFTTGRGTPTACAVAPTIKVATNSLIYENMKESMDINAGEIITGHKSIAEVGEEILALLIEVAEGRLTRGEILDQRDFAINRIGPTF